MANRREERKIRSLSGELELIDLGWGDAQDYKGVKLVLRPLSDLNKQNILDMLEYSDFENVYHCGNPDDLIFINTEDKNYLSEMLKQAEFLFKNHFDVFGLIEKGLAIDINTI